MQENVLTVLFTDVEGSTEIRTRFGDDLAGRVLGGIHSAVSSEVDHHAGRLIKSLGDGVLAVFDSPRRAVACAIGIQVAVADLNQSRSGDPVRVRIGLNSGTVFQEEGDVSGEAVNAAARIMSAAEGGQILVAGVVRDLVGTLRDVSFVETGVHHLKGFPDGWRLYEARSSSQLFLPLTGRTPFVGRKEEMDTLRRQLERVARGKGSVALIGGEPGVGKTRLAEELVAEAENHGFVTFIGHCYEMEAAQAYMPFVEILETTARRVARDVFRELLGDSAADLARFLPDIRRIYDDIPDPVDVPAEQERRYTFNSIARYMRRAAELSPILLILDDLHWADDATLLLLEHLALDASDLPVMIIGTYRDVELATSRPLARALEQLRRHHLAERLNLKRLSRDDVTMMLQRLSGSAPPESLVDAIYAETEGNAFFVEEVFRHLFEEGRLLDPTGRWRSDVEIAEVDVPESVRLVVGRRLERLRDETLRALASAAVIGRVFDFELLAVVEGVSGDDLLDAIEEAERAHLIGPIADSRSARYSFVHELVRQTLLGDMSLPRRQRLHLAVADAIEDVSGTASDHHAADLAHHLFQAGAAADEAKAVHYLTLAGERALATAASEEALSAFENALSFIEGHGVVERGRLLQRMGRALRGLRRWEEAVGAWEEALAIFEKTGDRADIARACRNLADRHMNVGAWTPAIDVLQRGLDALKGEADAARASLLTIQAIAYSWLGDYGRARDCLDEGAAIAEDLGDVRLSVGVLAAEAVHHWSFGDLLTSIEYGERAAGPLRETGGLWGLAHVLGYIYFDLCIADRWDEADAIHAELWPLATRLDHPAALRMASRWHESLHFMRTGDMERALEAGRADIGLMPELDTPWAADGHTWVGLIQAMRGEEEEGLARLEEGARTANRGAFYGAHLGALFMQLAMAGRRDECMALLEELDGLLPRPGEPAGYGRVGIPAYLAEGWAVLGEWDRVAGLRELLTAAMAGGNLWRGWRMVPTSILVALAAAASGEFDVAETHYEDSLGIARRRGSKLAETEVQRIYGLALVDLKPAEHTRGVGLLEDAAAGYASLGMDHLAHWTLGLADRPSVESPPPSGAEPRFKREGEFWTIGHADDPVRLKDTVGLRCLAQLLSNPGKEIHAADLAALASGTDVGTFRRRADLGDAGELLDEQAKESYRKRLSDLESERTEAEEWGDDERAARATTEIDALVDELGRATGLGGRDRRASSNVERARVNVTKAVKAAIGRIETHDADLGAHLRTAVRTGTFCVYAPGDQQLNWSL